MKTTVVGIFLFFVGFNSALAQEPNIIFITADGVRWQDVFRGPDPKFIKDDTAPTFPYLLSTLVPQGIMFGNRDVKSDMKVSNFTIASLPAYQSLMAGHEVSCLTNKCKRIKVESFPEYFQRVSKLLFGEVAIFSSWEPVRRALEHVRGTVFSNTGIEAFDDGVINTEVDTINTMQAQDIPDWKDARYDKYTYALGLRYLKTHQPRFLWISFDDSDEWGHKKNYKNYLQSLRQYDDWIREIKSTLDGMGTYGRNTYLIVTTDHGRGKKDWNQHGFIWPASKYIWMFAMGPGVQPAGIVNGGPTYEHEDLRPTFEAILGIPQVNCKKCGKPIKELVSNLVPLMP